MEDSWKLQGVGRYDKHFLEWKFQQGGGSKAKVPSIWAGEGAMNIFSNYTLHYYCAVNVYN